MVLQHNYTQFKIGKRTGTAVKTAKKKWEEGLKVNVGRWEPSFVLTNYLMLYNRIISWISQICFGLRLKTRVDYLYFLRSIAAKSRGKMQFELHGSLTSRNAPLPFWWWRETWPSPAASGSCWGSRPASPPGSRWWIRCRTPAPGCIRSTASFPVVKASHQSSSAGRRRIEEMWGRSEKDRREGRKAL